jgi:hypothetical protein
MLALEIRFDDLKDESWHVQNEQSYVQDDGVCCGPIACLKLMGLSRWVLLKKLENPIVDIGML